VFIRTLFVCPNGGSENDLAAPEPKNITFDPMGETGEDKIGPKSMFLRAKQNG
jgi:hypothetical protein